MPTVFQALCCGAQCGRGTPDTGPCVADTYGRRIAERAEAAGYVVVQGWQPIETAPRDGTAFHAWVDGECRRVCWTKTSHVPIYGFCLTDQGAEDCDLCDPTHWRPLPAPPTEPTR